ncbi:MAG: alpha/beta hydrolase [Actinomycetota bacterium]|nr:alpha/beta hydrolase [Actinomycetota bacterium]
MDEGINRFTARDGVELAYHVWGAGRPLVLLHGFLSSATMAWKRSRHVERLNEAGFAVIAPDLRAHGRSEAPTDPDRYGADVLPHDGLDLLDHLGLDDYDLGGYSIGARTVARMMTLGATPRRAVLAGTSYRGVIANTPPDTWFHRLFAGYPDHEKGSEFWRIQQYLVRIDADVVALERVLDSPTATDPDELAAITVPIRVVVGEDDHHRASAGELVDHLPNADLAVIPGDHTSAPSRRTFAAELVDHLTTS